MSKTPTRELRKDGFSSAYDFMRYLRLVEQYEAILSNFRIERVEYGIEEISTDNIISLVAKLSKKKILNLKRVLWKLSLDKTWKVV